MPVFIKSAGGSGGRKIKKLTPEQRASIKTVCSCCMKAAGADFRYEANITVTDDPGIRGLNRQFREKDAATDVLSFPLIDGGNGGLIEPDVSDVNPDTGRVMLGDIVISLEKAEEQAKAYGHSFDRELGFLAAHGMLHLLGFDHIKPAEEKKMTELQEKALLAAGLPREAELKQ